MAWHGMATLVLATVANLTSNQPRGPPAKELRLAGKGVLPLGGTHTLTTHIRSRTSLFSTCHESAQCVLQAIVFRRAPLSNIEMHAGAALGARAERQVAPFCALGFFSSSRSRCLCWLAARNAARPQFSTFVRARHIKSYTIHSWSWAEPR